MSPGRELSPLPALYHFAAAPGWISQQHPGKGTMPGPEPLAGSEPALLSCCKLRVFLCNAHAPGNADPGGRSDSLGSCTWSRAHCQGSRGGQRAVMHFCAQCRPPPTLPGSWAPLGIWGVASRHKTLAKTPQFQPQDHLLLSQPGSAQIVQKRVYEV